MIAFTGPTCQYPGCHAPSAPGTAVSLSSGKGARCEYHKDIEADREHPILKRGRGG